MSSATKIHEITRHGVTQVHEHCPQRAYVELAVPADVQEVAGASFTTVSRDQGWADNKSVWYTWFEVGLRRPGGARSDLGVVRIQHNPAGSSEFLSATTHWDRQHPELRSTVWLQSLRPGDIIQIIPRAVYPGWVNIVQEATIKIEYQPVEDTRPSLQRQATPIPVSYYKPLDHQDQQIRVLEIKPGGFNDAIQASFAYTSLAGLSGRKSDFDALSYCWGDAPDFVDIGFETEDNTVGPIKISRIVEGAIRRLRSQDVPLRIWIDAVCINQTDSEERSQQVSFMGSIYSSAQVVHIWLHEDYAGIEAALRVVRDMYNCKWRVCSGGDKCACSGTRHTLADEDLDAITQREGASYGFLQEVLRRHAECSPLFDSFAIQAAGGHGNLQVSHLMQSLFQHPWFQRVWVVQEAIVSRHTAVIYYGKETINWKELLFVNESLGSRHFDGLSPHTRGLLTMPAIWNTLADAEDYGRPATSQSQDGSAGTAGSGDRQNRLTILEVFLAALDMKASDLRDKLFALLSFGQETRVAIPPALRPDYTKALPNVMADFTRWWIREYRSLDIVSFIHCQPTRSWQRTLGQDDPRMKQPFTRPTWALSTEGYSRWSHMTLLRQFPFFQASANSVPYEGHELGPVQDTDPLIIRLRGLKVGSIAAVDNPPRSMVYPYTRKTPPSQNDIDFITVYHHIIDPEGYTGIWSHPSTSKKVDDMGPDSRNRIFSDHTYAHAAYFPTSIPQFAVLPTGKSGDPDLYRRFPQQRQLPTCIDRCFFVLSNGFCGLCPWTVREGDVVVLLYGGKVPYVIRQLQIPSEGPTRYELIGECYVEGNNVMNGEFATAAMSNGEPQIFELA